MVGGGGVGSNAGINREEERQDGGKKTKTSWLPAGEDGGEQEETGGISQWEGLRNLRKGAEVGSDRGIVCVQGRGGRNQKKRVGDRLEKR